LTYFKMNALRRGRYLGFFLLKLKYNTKQPYKLAICAKITFRLMVRKTE
jgi:hypothetical protein